MSDDDIKVSILCTVYNNEKFLRKCLESLVCQKTNFNFEILIHDDASTDKSSDIILEFQKRYPKLIVAIFEKENQYSKGIPISNSILFPKSKGKYIAFCEGDDYWCDENKLQKQFDFMENNLDCSMCVHNTKIVDLMNTSKIKYFNSWNSIHELTEEEVFFGWNVHTTSYFIRRNIYISPKFSYKYWFGDYIRITMAFFYGKIIALPEVMSVYNINNVDGVTYRIHNKITEKNLKKMEMRKEYLIEYNDYTNNKYLNVVNDRCNEIDLEILLIKIFIKKLKYKEFHEYRKEIKNHIYITKYMKKLSVKNKLKFYFKYSNYITYLIINAIKKV